MTRPFPLLALALSCLSIASCASSGRASGSGCSVRGAQPADELIAPNEKHFAHLWRVAAGGENAEGYWSFDGARLTLQRRDPAHGVECDRIYATDPENGGLVQVSSGLGTTTCSFFLPGDQEILFASTQAEQQGCPPKPDMSQGYVWMVHPEFDIYVRDLATGRERPLLSGRGYDAEATVSPRGDRIVFTSTRGGDLDLWTCRLDGSDLRQVTHAPGYDGGGVFSHDGKSIVYRHTVFTPGKESEEIASYKQLLASWRVKPTRMEIAVCDTDGGNVRQLTQLGGANFAPCFTPDDQRIVFASNHKDPHSRNFDLYSIDREGGSLELVTSYDGFDSFPLFSPDGRYLAFCSNRGGSVEGETCLYIAEWR